MSVSLEQEKVIHVLGFVHLLMVISGFATKFIGAFVFILPLLVQLRIKELSTAGFYIIFTNKLVIFPNYKFNGILI